MPVATGARFKLYVALQSGPGAPATTNFIQLPCYSFDLGAEEGLQSDPVLSTNATRDEGDPFLDNPTVSGTAQVPLDPNSYAWWLRALFGAPVTTSPITGVYSHFFISGRDAALRPYHTVIKAYPDAGLYYRYVDVRANSLAMDATNTGRARATVGMVGVTEEIVTSSAFGTPTLATESVRGLSRGGFIRQNGSVMADVTRFSFNFSNNMEAVRTIHAFTPIDGYDDGLASCSGTADIRLKNTTISAQALAATPSSLEYLIAMGTEYGTGIGYTWPRSFFARTKNGVNGPGPVAPGYTWRASNDGSVAALMTVSLNNAVASYSF